MADETIMLEVSQAKSTNLLEQTQSFNIPEQVSSISIEAQTEQRLWLTYMIYDPENNLRAQFMKVNAPQPLVIHSDINKTGANTVGGEIQQGQWRIEIVIVSNEAIEANQPWCKIGITLNDALLNKKGTEIQSWQNKETTAFHLSEFDEDKVFNNESKWYKGDFHTHTIYTDGEMTREENMVSAKNQQLDFFVATDHNLTPTSWVNDSEVLVIPGVEVTSMLGHFNILNAKTAPFSENRLIDMATEEGMNKLITSDYGNAIISVNHPFLTEWKWLLKETPLDKVDTLEIWNDPTYQYNPQATEWALIAWNYLLNDGYQITGIGGSDSHLKPEDKYEGSSEPSLIGDPGTFVYCDKLSTTNLVKGLKRGNVTVSRGEMVQFQMDELISGNSTDKRTGTITASVDTDEAIYFEWIVDGEVAEKVTDTNSTYPFDFTKDDDHHWIRVDVRHEDGRLYGFSNPIYFGDKKPKMKKWGEVNAIMEKYGAI